MVLGAAGQLGAAICAALLTPSSTTRASSAQTRRGMRLVMVDRDEATVRERIGDWAGQEVVDAARAEPGAAQIVAGDPTDAGLVADLLDGAACCVHADVRSRDDHLRTVAAAAVAAGAHYLDVRSTSGHLTQMAEAVDDVAKRAGRVVLPGLTADLVPGEALALLAAGAVAHPREVHVSFALPSASGVLLPVSRVATPGGRRGWHAQLVGPAPALVNGVPLDEQVAEARRLAWFPRPVGPVHAVGVGSAVAWALPRTLLGISTVRSYLAMPGWRAELVQFLGGASRWAPVHRRLESRARRGGLRSRSILGGTRWAVVAEAQGAGGQVARAWANGSDPLAVLGGIVAILVDELDRDPQGERPGGVHPPSAVLAPDTMLDLAAANLPLRWSLVRPSAN